MPKSTAPKREKIGVLASQHDDDDAEEQREGDVDGDNERAAQIAQKDPLKEEDQRAAEPQDYARTVLVVTLTSVVLS